MVAFFWFPDTLGRQSTGEMWRQLVHLVHGREIESVAGLDGVVLAILAEKMLCIASCGNDLRLHVDIRSDFDLVQSFFL